MTDLPARWESVPLGLLANFIMGQAPPGSESNFDGIGTPFVKAGEFGLDRPVIREWTTKPLKLARETDVLICVVGATAGKINLGANCAIGRSVAAIRPHEELDQLYLYNFLKTKVETIREGATGSAQGVISRDALSQIHIPFPPFLEQQRIATKLDQSLARTARARKELNRIPTLLAKYKRTLLANAFSGDLTREWRTVRPPRESKWEKKCIGDLIHAITAGKNLRCDERPPLSSERGVVKVSAVTWGEFDPSQAKTLPQTFLPAERTRVRIGDLLISRANTLEFVGAVVIVKSTPDNLFLSDKILRLEVDQHDKTWLMWFLRSPEGRRAIEGGATGNQLSMRNLSQAALRQIIMPWPSEEERREIVRQIELANNWLDRVVGEQNQATRQLPSLESAILAKAFRGDLVPQDPTDEPASGSLSRMRARKAEEPNFDRGSQPRKVRPLTMTNPKKQLEEQLKDWPERGLSFEEIAARIAGDYEAVREAVFSLLEGAKPALKQEFNKKDRLMRIRKTAR
jgi:type I restriction enzyme S subunit